MKPRVTAIEHSIEVRALPQHGSVKAGAKCLGISSDVAESDAIELARLDLDRDTSGDAGCHAHVLLAKPASKPESSKGRARALIVHASRIAPCAHPPLTPM
jgi:hypothetical protein